MLKNLYFWWAMRPLVGKVVGVGTDMSRGTLGGTVLGIGLLGLTQEDEDGDRCFIPWSTINRIVAGPAYDKGWAEHLAQLKAARAEHERQMAQHKAEEGPRNFMTLADLEPTLKSLME